MEIIFRAHDGKEFDNAHDCVTYESAHPIYRMWNDYGETEDFDTALLVDIQGDDDFLSKVVTKLMSPQKVSVARDFISGPTTTLSGFCSIKMCRTPFSNIFAMNKAMGAKCALVLPGRRKFS